MTAKHAKKNSHTTSNLFSPQEKSCCTRTRKKRTLEEQGFSVPGVHRPKITGQGNRYSVSPDDRIRGKGSRPCSSSGPVPHGRSPTRRSGPNSSSPIQNPFANGKNHLVPGKIALTRLGFRFDSGGGVEGAGFTWGGTVIKR